MKNTLLTQYELVNVEGLGSLRTPMGNFPLHKLTDKQASDLLANGYGGHYLKKKEPAEDPKKALKA